jgi:hypothetical protein
MLHTLPLGQASQLPHGSLQCSLTRGAGIVVLYVLVLAALAAVSGFMLGQWRSRWAGIAAGVALAFISALVLRKLELSAGIGIPAVAAVLAISQAAYLIGLMRGGQGPGARFLPDEQIGDVPDHGPDGDVGHEREGQRSPSDTAEINKQRDVHPIG